MSHHAATDPSGSRSPAAARGPRLLACRGVGVELGGRRVLSAVDLEVHAGEILALVGPNGGGKTTLIRTLAGLLRPQSGEVRWVAEDGSEAGEPPFAIAYVPQRPQADFRYPVTVREVVGMPLLGGRRFKPWLSADDRARVEAALEQLKISALATRPIGSLSGGQQQRALVARAVVVRPRLLLLDEPTTGIDCVGQEELIELLEKLRERDGVGIVFSTHHPGDAVAAIDRGFVVDGQVRAVPIRELDHEYHLHAGKGEPGA